MRNLLRYSLMALLLLVVALVSALTTMRLAIQVREVRVPDLRTKTPAEAKRLAEQDGLAAQVESSYYSAIVPEGRVLSQTPLAGTLVRRGWQLGLALSLARSGLRFRRSSGRATARPPSALLNAGCSSVLPTTYNYTEPKVVKSLRKILRQMPLTFPRPRSACLSHNPPRRKRL